MDNVKEFVKKNRTRLIVGTAAVVGAASLFIIWASGVFHSSPEAEPNNQKPESRAVSDLLAIKLPPSVDLSQLSKEQLELLEGFEASEIEEGISDEEVKGQLLETQKALKDRKFLSKTLEDSELNEDNCEKLRILVNDESWEKYNFGEEEEAAVEANIKECEMLKKKSKYKPLVNFIKAPEENLVIAKADNKVKQLVGSLSKLPEEEQKLIIGESFKEFQEFAKRPATKAVIKEVALEAPAAKDEEMFVRPPVKKNKVKKDDPSANQKKDEPSSNQKKDEPSIDSLPGTATGKPPRIGTATGKPSRIGPKMKLNPVSSDKTSTTGPKSDENKSGESYSANTTNTPSANTENKDEPSSTTVRKDDSQGTTTDSQSVQPRPKPVALGYGLIPIGRTTTSSSDKGKSPATPSPTNVGLKRPTVPATPANTKKPAADQNVILSFLNFQIPKAELEKFDHDSVDAELKKYIFNCICGKLKSPLNAFNAVTDLKSRYLEAMGHPLQGLNQEPMEAVKQVNWNALPEEIQELLQLINVIKSYCDIFRKIPLELNKNFIDFVYIWAAIEQLKSPDGRFTKNSPQALALASHAHAILRTSIQTLGNSLDGLYYSFYKTTVFSFLNLRPFEDFDLFEWKIEDMEKFNAALEKIQDIGMKQVLKPQSRMTRRNFIDAVDRFLLVLLRLYWGLASDSQYAKIVAAKNMVDAIKKNPNF